MNFTPLNLSDVFLSKLDPDDQRLGDNVSTSLDDLPPANNKHSSYMIFGYPDDDGVALNGGRPGAKEAPTEIRKILYKMTPPAFLEQTLSEEAHSKIIDGGNLNTKKIASLAERHQIVRENISQFYQKKLKLISFGGGHDYGFPDAAGFMDEYSAKTESSSHSHKNKPLIINFDAHLDVRPSTHGFHSGTPFYRLLEAYPETDLIEVGLQSQCNAKSHLKWAIERGVQVSFQDDRLASKDSLTTALHRFLSGSQASRPCFISVDIDGFSSAFAPGASQVWPTGFTPDDFFEAFSWCLKNLDVRGLGIYEVAPKFDVDNQTSRLAALIAHRFIFQL